MKVQTAELVTSAFDRSGLLRDPRPQVAFAGRSNVGKSTLLNRLLGRKSLARTSSKPGRTRSINYFLINDGFYFVDLPGYGYAKASRRERDAWARLVEDYLDVSGDRVQVVLLIDAKIRSPLDSQAVGYFSGLGIGLVVAATKIDRIPRNQRPSCLASIAEHLHLPGTTSSDVSTHGPSPSRQPRADAPVIGVSGKTGEGVKELWSQLQIT